MNNLLTIAIPTYNRVQKLKRLIENINNQEYSFNYDVEILISDNFSNDGTSEFISELKIHKPFFKISTYSQKFNLGFDGNISFLYANSSSKYIWFFADDDVLLPNAINYVVDCLTAEMPSVLLFSFGQPPGSKKGVYNFDTSVKSFYCKKEIIELSIRFPKISTYVLINSNFNINDKAFLETQKGYGWMHLGLTFSVINNCESPKLTIISNVLAECDDEFDMLTWSPNSIKESFQIYKHQLIIRDFPELFKIQYISSFLNSIQFCFAAKIGALRVLNMFEYDDFISKLRFRLILFIYPKSLIQFFLLKFKLTKLHNFIKK
jgi:glycosyltransferase involved in cell wall biosynthesis